jgi:hypothetical protein
MYSTTREFLIRFGLRDLSDLPKVEEMAEALGFEVPAGLTQQGPSQPQLDLDGLRARLPSRCRRTSSPARRFTRARLSPAFLSFCTLVGRELPIGAHLEMLVHNRTDAHAFERADRMADGVAHLAHLARSALRG